MERSVIDALSSALRGALVAPKHLRDALLACLDLARADDEDAQTLRLILEDHPEHEALDEFQLAFSEIRSRTIAQSR